MKTLVSVLASKIRRGTATADESHEYEILAALEAASLPRVKAPRSIYDLEIARVMWPADVADVAS